MRMYDFELAKNIIDTFKDLNVLDKVYLGMQEDWSWTAQCVFEYNEFITELNSETKIGGINGSSWATPIIELELTNGETETFECFKGEWTKDIDFRLQKAKDWVNGCISLPCQISRIDVNVKEFKK